MFNLQLIVFIHNFSHHNIRFLIMAQSYDMPRVKKASMSKSLADSRCNSSADSESKYGDDEYTLEGKCVGQGFVNGESTTRHLVSPNDTFVCKYCHCQVTSSQLSDHFKVRCKLNPHMDKEFARIKKEKDCKRAKEFSTKKRREEALKAINHMLVCPGRTVYQYFHLIFSWFRLLTRFMFPKTRCLKKAMKK